MTSKESLSQTGRGTPLCWKAMSANKRTPGTSVPPLDPDERCAAAQTKVQRLEAALAAFGEKIDSPEKDVLKDFLALAVFATSRAQSARIGSGSLPEASVRLAAEVPPPPSVSGIRGCVREFEETSSKTTCVPDRPPSHEQDLEVWMSDKHLELRDALEFGDTTSVLELSKLLSGGAALMQRIREQCCPVTTSAVAKHGHHARRGSRHGYRIVRVVEAKKPRSGNSTSRDG